MSWRAKAPLTRGPQDVEETQLAALRAEVAAGKAALQQAEQQYAELKGALATVYQALGPQVRVRHGASMYIATCHTCHTGCQTCAPNSSTAHRHTVTYRYVPTLTPTLSRWPSGAGCCVRLLGAAAGGLQRQRGVVRRGGGPAAQRPCGGGTGRRGGGGPREGAADTGVARTTRRAPVAWNQLATEHRLFVRKDSARTDGCLPCVPRFQAPADQDGRHTVVTGACHSCQCLQTRNLYMSSERREVALTAEMDSALSALRQTNMVRESTGPAG